MLDTWMPEEFYLNNRQDLESLVGQRTGLLDSLVKAKTPAIIFRSVYDPSDCVSLIQRFTDIGLIRDSRHLDQSQYWINKNINADMRTRIDIGTSLGNLGSDKDFFFRHAKATQFLFKFLFQGYINPIHQIYDSLSTLTKGKTVTTAYEADGQQYGPAIFRAHYESHAYKPHIDSVKLREKRINYNVHRFDHQLAGILCFQNSDHNDTGVQSLLYRCLWSPEVQMVIENNTFHQYAQEKKIQTYQVNLQPGDLYFFNTHCVHEVPAVEGNKPRIVLAVFIGYSQSEKEIFVWS